jgi:hypothetical protein
MTTSNRLSKEALAWAGRYAVALELSRRGVVSKIKTAQKRTVILVERQAGAVTIQVNSKQGTEWPGVHGLSGPSGVLVLVDFEGKSKTERPDCYIIYFPEWKTLLRQECKKWQAKYPDMYIDENWTLIYPTLLRDNSSTVASVSSRDWSISTKISGRQSPLTEVLEMGAQFFGNDDNYERWT